MGARFAIRCGKIVHVPEQANGAALADRPEVKKRIVFVVGVALALGSVGAVAYRHSSSEPQPDLAVRDVPRLDGKWIRYSPDFARRSKIELAGCETGSLSPIVGVTGTVTFDPELVAAIGTRISGRVVRVAKFPGDLVRAGEVVAELESAELGQAQAALVSARAHAEAAIANENRVDQLALEGASSKRAAELAHAGASAAKADVVAGEQRLRAMGGTSAGEVGILRLTSPIAGKVVELHISRGQSVEPSLTAVRVADLRRVWIDLAVFERELGHIRVGDEVEISPQTNLSVVVRGRVAHVGDIIDLETRSAAVRVVVDNTDASLRPGQSVAAKIHTATTTSPAAMVRLESVTGIDGKPTVFVAHDETSVEPRTIVLGPRDASHVLVTAGLLAGEHVVVNGVFALKAEVFR